MKHKPHPRRRQPHGALRRTAGPTTEACTQTYHRRLHAFAAAHAPATVIVRAEYATAFRQPPRDGNTYLVQDPKQRGVIHETDAAGRYTRWSDDRPLQIKVEVKQSRDAKKPARQLAQLPKARRCWPCRHPTHCPSASSTWIASAQITDLASPSCTHNAISPPREDGRVQKGAAVRWNEAEVAAWVQRLCDRRGQTGA